MLSRVVAVEDRWKHRVSDENARMTREERGQRPLLTQTSSYTDGPTSSRKAIGLALYSRDEAWCQAYGIASVCPDLISKLRANESCEHNTTGEQVFEQQWQEFSTSQDQSTTDTSTSTGSSELITAANEIRFCQLFVLEEYLFLLPE